MTIADERLRPPPSVREAGTELPLGPLRLVLFAFEAGSPCWSTLTCRTTARR